MKRERKRDEEDAAQREIQERTEPSGLGIAFCVPSSAECLLYGHSMALLASCLSSDCASTMFCVLALLVWHAIWMSLMVSLVKGRCTSLLHSRASEQKRLTSSAFQESLI